MNIVIVKGRISTDIELRFGQSGKAYTRFNLAVPRDKETTDFINCVAFGKTAEVIAQYTKKGNQLLVNGQLQVETYEKDGEKKTMYKVFVSSIDLIDSNDKKENKQESLTDRKQDDFDENDFPF